MQALEDSDRKTITLNFSLVLDMSEQAPVFDTCLAFKDKDTEGGMDVTKTFRVKRRKKFEDPNAPFLPGVNPKDGSADNGQGGDQGEGAPEKSKRASKAKKPAKKKAARSKKKENAGAEPGGETTVQE